MREHGRRLRQGIGRGLGLRSRRASAPQLLRLERREVGQGQPRRDGDRWGVDARQYPDDRRPRQAQDRGRDALCYAPLF